MAHKEILQQAEMDCRRIDECLPYYLENGDSLLEQARAQVVRAEYAVGGTIHRGCYCPARFGILSLAVQNEAFYVKSQV